MVDATPIYARFVGLSPLLDERGRRSFAASEARAAGRGGIAAVSRATGIAVSTIGRGLKELDSGSGLPGSRVRRHGCQTALKTFQLTASKSFQLVRSILAVCYVV